MGPFIALGLLVILVGLYVTFYLLNKRIELPEEYKIVSEQCDNCQSHTCSMKN